jgi:hypothetical protein
VIRFLQRGARAARDPKAAVAKTRYAWWQWTDFRLFRSGLKPYRRFVPSAAAGPGLLIAAGMGLNTVWAQLWTLLSIPAMVKGYRPFVLLSPLSLHLRRYFALLGIEAINLDEHNREGLPSLAPQLRADFDAAKSFDNFRTLRWQRMPIGDIVLSTYCRHTGKVMIDVNDAAVRAELARWLEYIWRHYHAAAQIFAQFGIKAAYFTETFMEEHGAIYYAALQAGLNVLRFAGTVRDDAIIVQHRAWGDAERLHHAALAPSSWENVKRLHNLPLIRAQLEQNFADRYSDKWHRSKRNQPGTQLLEADAVRAQLGLPPGRKVAVIYSHILYDTIFFFGTDLFEDYATWLVETIKIAVANDKLEWYIKVHPSNIWRGELNELMAGRYQEESLIEQHIGKLPPHVHIVPADSKISPLSWMQLADFGLTVRGTSGLEMAAMGKTVITAGTGRYEGCGFTYDPPTKQAYLDLLARLPDIAEITPEQTELAQRYAHAIFNLKPFTLTSVIPRLATGKTRVVASDDIVYVPRPPAGDALPDDLARFADFLDQPGCIDLLNELK